MADVSSIALFFRDIEQVRDSAKSTAATVAPMNPATLSFRPRANTNATTPAESTIHHSSESAAQVFEESLFSSDENHLARKKSGTASILSCRNCETNSRLCLASS